ncbi:MAG TPA: hypothetical protein VG965_02285 [Patescibacteria group bacterium]|nr:hypothetical protein [Patescibacteria group bacterium]
MVVEQEKVRPTTPLGLLQEQRAGFDRSKAHVQTTIDTHGLNLLTTRAAGIAELPLEQRFEALVSVGEKRKTAVEVLTEKKWATKISEKIMALDTQISLLTRVDALANEGYISPNEMALLSNGSSTNHQETTPATPLPHSNGHAPEVDETHPEAEQDKKAYDPVVTRFLAENGDRPLTMKDLPRALSVRRLSAHTRALFAEMRNSLRIYSDTETIGQKMFRDIAETALMTGLFGADMGAIKKWLADNQKDEYSGSELAGSMGRSGDLNFAKKIRDITGTVIGHDLSRSEKIPADIAIYVLARVRPYDEEMANLMKGSSHFKRVDQGIKPAESTEPKIEPEDGSTPLIIRYSESARDDDGQLLLSENRHDTGEEEPYTAMGLISSFLSPGHLEEVDDQSPLATNGTHAAASLEESPPLASAELTADELPNANDYFFTAALLKTNKDELARLGLVIDEDSMKVLDGVILRSQDEVDASNPEEAILLAAEKWDILLGDAISRDGFTSQNLDGQILSPLLTFWRGNKPSDLILHLVEYRDHGRISDENRPPAAAATPDTEIQPKPAPTEELEDENARAKCDIEDRYSLPHVMRSVNVRNGAVKHHKIPISPDALKKMNSWIELERDVMQSRGITLPPKDEAANRFEDRFYQYARDPKEFIRLNEDANVRWFFLSLFPNLTEEEASFIGPDIVSDYLK